MAKTRTLTVSVNEESERRFRKLALSKYGKKKGTLGKALTAAMDKWVEQVEGADLTAKTLELMKKGVKTKKKWKFNREEIYEERFKNFK
jgi:hypothetical protein